MKTDRIPWHLIAGIILGLGMGLLISWVIAPLEYTDTPPSLLRTDFKDEYRAVIASAYLSTGDLPRAQTRLDTLNDPDDIEALTVQAQRALAGGSSPASLSALAALAADLEREKAFSQVTPTSTRFLTQTSIPPTETGTPATIPANNIPVTSDDDVTETPAPVINTRTPRPSPTATPTLGAPFVVDTQDEICSTAISEGLLMVYVSDAASKPIPGAEIVVSWDGGEEHFFTGFKPELGNGYADFTITPNTSYTVHLAGGSTVISNLNAPPCQDSDGVHYWGSIRLRFKQP